MQKKKIAALGLATALAVSMFGSALTVFAADGSKYNGPSGDADGPSSGTTGVYIQDAGYVTPDHPGYNPASYEFEVPVQLLYAMKYDGTLVGGWMQYDNEDYKPYGEIKNHSQLPIQVTSVKFTGNTSEWNFTDSSGKNYVHFVVNGNRADDSIGSTLLLDSMAMLSTVDTSNDENFHLYYEAIPDKSDTCLMTDDGTGVALRVTHDIKLASQLGTITWTVNGDSYYGGVTNPVNYDVTSGGGNGGSGSTTSDDAITDFGSYENTESDSNEDQTTEVSGTEPTDEDISAEDARVQ